MHASIGAMETCPGSPGERESGNVRATAGCSEDVGVDVGEGACSHVDPDGASGKVIAPNNGTPGCWKMEMKATGISDRAVDLKNPDFALWRKRPGGPRYRVEKPHG